ncbi:hypothetical protein QOT17_001280 [Balamuthia mandrillaris]
MEEIPDELVLKILTVVARPVCAIEEEGTCEEGFLVAREVCLHLSLVCRRWHGLSGDNSIWQPLFLFRWPQQSPLLRVRSWKKFYRARHQHMALQSWDDAPIERCSWIKKCPMSWVGNFKSLQEGSSPTTRYCDICKKEVHWVSNQPELELAAAKGLCVAFGPPQSSSVDAEDEFYELVGFADPDYY